MLFMNKKCILNQMSQQLKEYTKKIDFSEWPFTQRHHFLFNASVVQWLEFLTSNQKMSVRFRSDAPSTKYLVLKIHASFLLFVAYF